MLSCSCIIFIAWRHLTIISLPYPFFLAVTINEDLMTYRYKGKELRTKFIRYKNRKHLWLELSYSPVLSPFSNAYGQCFLVMWHGHWLMWQNILECWVFAQRIQVFSWKLWDKRFAWPAAAAAFQMDSQRLGGLTSQLANSISAGSDAGGWCQWLSFLPTINSQLHLDRRGDSPGISQLLVRSHSACDTRTGRKGHQGRGTDVFSPCFLCLWSEKD